MAFALTFTFPVMVLSFVRSTTVADWEGICGGGYKIRMVIPRWASSGRYSL